MEVTLDDLGAFAGTALEVLRDERERTESRLRRLAPNQSARKLRALRRLRDLDTIIGALDAAERRHIDRYVAKVLGS